MRNTSTDVVHQFSAGAPVENYAIASRIMTGELQEIFSALSGDKNPMHMDDVAARRTQAGMRVVHGVHTMLWALESIAAAGNLGSTLSSINAKFLKWVYVGEECRLIRPEQRLDSTLLKVEVGNLTVLSIKLMYESSEYMPSQDSLIPSPATPLPSALDLSFADLNGRSGNAYTANSTSVRDMFPHLSDILGPVAVAEIAACSYIVGMEAPGLNSTFSSLKVRFATQSEAIFPRIGLNYRVVEKDERFRKVKLAVFGNAIDGSIEAFVRHPPAQQSSIDMIATRVAPHEFKGMNALIIGGSRGLGEVTAKLVAAGGGTSTITYSLGKVDAERVVNQIREWGGDSRSLLYDVRIRPEDQIGALQSAPTHLFYFATSVIYRRKQGVLSGGLLAEFIQFYVKGFYDLCISLTTARQASTRGRTKLIVFYPSTVYLEDRPPGLTEYVMLKAAGEQMCRDMNRFLPDVHIITSRLPRLRTDQTAAVVPERELNPMDILLPIVREMQLISNNP